MMREIQFSLSYYADPISEKIDGYFQEIELDKLPISDELKKIIDDIDRKTKKTMNLNAPVGQRFGTKEENEELIKNYLLIWERLKDELPKDYILSR